MEASEVFHNRDKIVFFYKKISSVSCVPLFCTVIKMFTQMTNLLSTVTNVYTSCLTKRSLMEPLNNNKVRHPCVSRRTRSSSCF